VPGVRDLETHEERVDATLPARAAARFRFARNRVVKIADGTPAFSRSQYVELAEIFLSAAGDPDA